MRRLLQKLAFYAFHLLVARPVLLGVIGVRYRRRHVVPAGPCLVVANHNSHLDAAVLLTMFTLRRLAHVHPVAAADYFEESWLKRTMALLLMNGIPIRRRPVAGQDPLAPLVQALKAGESLIFFPEGSRGEAGVVGPFRRGVGLLIRELPGLLVVPVFLSGPERIWPRGNVVPVPLNIDVHVGKPRTYPASEDPRVIAEKVREDVMALAPTPPPAPGRRVSPPVRIAVCCIDAGQRTEAARRITERLGVLQPTLGVAEMVLQADALGLREAAGPIVVGHSRLWLRFLARLVRTSRRFRGEEFVALVERAQISEALNHGGDTRFVVVDGCCLVELLAFQRAAPDRGGLDESGIGRLAQILGGQKSIPLGRLWWFLRRAPEVWLIHTLNLARPPVPELLVHIKVPVARVMERLRASGMELGAFETPGFLERLDEAYGKVGEVLRRRRRVQFHELQVAEADPGAVAEHVAAACQRFIISRAETGS